MKVTDQRTKQDWAVCMRELVDEQYPEAERVVVVMDNLNTHVLSALYEVYEPAEVKRIVDPLEIHYTPKHGSWLNVAEIELSVLSRQCPDRCIPDQESLQREVAAWEAARNAKLASVEWHLTTSDARIKLKNSIRQLIHDRGLSL